MYIYREREGEVKREDRGTYERSMEWGRRGRNSERERERARERRLREMERKRERERSLTVPLSITHHVGA